MIVSLADLAALRDAAALRFDREENYYFRVGTTAAYEHREAACLARQKASDAYDRAVAAVAERMRLAIEAAS